MPYGSFTYRVENTRIVEPSALWVTKNVGYPRLVLSACHPLYNASMKRIIVSKRLRPPQFDELSLAASNSTTATSSASVVATECCCSVTVAMLSANEAWAYGVLGDAARAMSALCRGRRRICPRVRPVAPWVSFFGPTDLEALAGMTHLELGAFDPSSPVAGPREPCRRAGGPRQRHGAQPDLRAHRARRRRAPGRRPRGGA